LAPGSRLKHTVPAWFSPRRLVLSSLHKEWTSSRDSSPTIPAACSLLLVSKLISTEVPSWLSCSLKSQLKRPGRLISAVHDNFSSIQTLFDTDERVPCVHNVPPDGER
jgi:hypothetical protein